MKKGFLGSGSKASKPKPKAKTRAGGAVPAAPPSATLAGAGAGASSTNYGSVREPLPEVDPELAALVQRETILPLFKKQFEDEQDG